jgi:phospholipid/cholesterol/gamma-HCH transport system substrate-binding protein
VISSRTKKQLLVFVFITLVGVAYVGARYARLDRLIYDSAYDGNAQFAQSGGIFTGAEVT